MKLQSQIQYEESIDLPTVSDSEYREKSRNHKNFLKQPLKLGMFVPCDENDMPLDEPKGWKNEECDTNDCCSICKCEQYQQAKESVIFEGFEIKNSKIYNEEHIQFLGMIGNPSKYADINPLRWRDRFVNTKTIEELVNYNLSITDSAIKQLEL